MKKTLVLATILMLAAAPLAAEQATHDMSKMQHAMPETPYMKAEMTMHDRMMMAVGSGPAETWVRKMIEHHRGAISMSEILVAQSNDKRATDMARRTIEAQGREVEELQEWLKDHGKKVQ